MSNLEGPITRKEVYFSNLNGGVTELPTPISREDFYLAYLCGAYTGELPTPISRLDYYLSNLCINGGVGGIKGILVNVNILKGIYTTTP